MNIIKFQNFISESVSDDKFKTIPEGASIPSSGVVKFGIDPTSDKLHLGHLIPILMVKKLKEKGMDVHIILGTFTAQLGDPSGKDSMRPILTLDSTKSNADSIISQIHRVLGKDITVHYNHEWFNEMSLPEIMKTLSKYTVDYLMSREAFQNRQQSGGTIGAHEIIVPLLQGLDSVKLKAKVEVGGSDQMFNFLLSRDVQSKSGQDPEICIMAPIINGTDGRKMSKSYNNCIYINDVPKDVFGKAMSISDEIMKEWLPIFIENYDSNKHPMELKKTLASKITDIIWGDGSGQKERDNFEKSVQKGIIPDNIPSLPSAEIVSYVSTATKSSKGEAKRLISQGGVTIIRGESEFKSALETKLEPGDIVRCGKRNYSKVQ